MEKKHIISSFWDYMSRVKGTEIFYEGYSGALKLRGVPYKTVDTIKDAAKPYGTIVE